MAATIKIKRSTGNTVPTTVAGELAYSAALSAGEDAGLGKLYIGNPSSNTAIAIGGSFYTNLLSGTAGTASASKAVILDASNSITGLGSVGANTVTVNYVTAGNVEITTLTAGNVRISTNTVTTTGANQDLVLNPNGTGKIKLYDLYTLPDTNGTNGYVLTTDGTGNTSWQASSSSLSLAGNSGTGTVSLLNQVFTVTGSNGISTTASSNNLTLALDANLQKLAAFSGTGLVSRAADGTLAGVEIAVSGNNLSITSANGVSGNPTLSLTGNVGSLANLTDLGLVALTAAGTVTARSVVTASDTRITVASGNGVSGNISLDLATVTQNTDPTFATFQKVNVDSYGRVNGTTPVVQSDITALVDSVYVNVAGDTMTGNLIMSANATVTGLPNPVASGDAANKNYVDNAVAGLTWKQPVIALASTSVAANSSTTSIDGVSLTTNDRVLLTAQANPGDNGIYVVGAGDWNRSPDANTPAELNGAAVFVLQGTSYANTGWTQTAELSVIGDPQTWVQFAGGGAVVGGTGINVVGNQVNFKVGRGLEVNSTTTNIDVSLATGNAIQFNGSNNVTLTLNGAANTSGLFQDSSGLTIAAGGVTNAMLTNSSIAIGGTSGGPGSVSLGQTLTVNGDGGAITTTVSGNTIAVNVATATDVVKGVASFSNTNFAVASGVVTIKDGGVNLASNTVTGTLAVANGGTGANTLTANQLLIGNGTSPVTQSAFLAFSANTLTVGTATLATSGANVSLTATGTDGNINLVPNGAGKVNIGASGSGTIASSSGQTLTVTGDAGLTLGATSNDITMTLANANTAKVTISGPSSNTYAEAMGLNDLVNRDFVENYAVIDGGTY